MRARGPEPVQEPGPGRVLGKEPGRGMVLALALALALAQAPAMVKETATATGSAPDRGCREGQSRRQGLARSARMTRAERAR
jgi:hypothetical protein